MDKENFTTELKKILRLKGIKQKELADMIGVAPPTISNIINGRDTLGKKQAIDWGDALNIDPLWLMTQGEQGTPPSATPIAAPALSGDIISVPLLDLDVRGGNAANDMTDIEPYIVGQVPFSRTIATDGDVVVPVYGDSMSPCYPSGSHILIRPLEMWREWIELGQAYVLELTDWRRTLKVVRKGSTPERWRLCCYNPDHDDTEIPIAIVSHMWQVIAVVKREVM